MNYDGQKKRQELANELQSGIRDLKLSIPQETQNQLIEFLYFLKKWNRSFNLTAITALEKMLTHHLLDSLSIAPYLKGKRILDVGTGAGFPGVPLAMLYPHKHFALLDSSGKKTRFLIQAKASFNLNNVEVIQSRVENFRTEECFDAIIYRAVGKIDELMPKSEHVLCPEGQFLFMKGIYPRTEINNIEQPFTVYDLQVPGLKAQRHLVVIKRRCRHSAT